MFADVTFFGSIPYFPYVLLLPLKLFLSVPLPVPLPAPAYDDFSLVSLAHTSEPPTSKPVWGFIYIYTHRQKVPASEPAPVDHSAVYSHPPQPSTSPSDLNIPIALRKCNRSCVIILFQSSFSMINLTPHVVSCFIRFCVYTQVL